MKDFLALGSSIGLNRRGQGKERKPQMHKTKVYLGAAVERTNLCVWMWIVMDWFNTT